MNPSALLDFWGGPEGAGEPVALLATTFALEPEFFERDCLARFLAVSSVEEESGSIDDTVARLELEERLRAPSITVLADRSTRAERSSFQWDLLHCHVPTGLLHAKVTVLLWENATRVILGSANLTSAGYRRQIELAMSADLGRGCLLPGLVLSGLADELESYLALVPSFSGELPAVSAARSTLELFRERVTTMPSGRSPVRVALAPTSPTVAPLDAFDQVWKGPRPLRATHLSPFWDSDDLSVLTAVGGLLRGQPARDRAQRVAVTLTPTGGTPFASTLHPMVDEVRHLVVEDDEIRLLHAKCLLVQSNTWVAALVGSSNHTKPGLGLAMRRHRELNVWIGAPAESEEGKALAALVKLGDSLAEDVPDAAPIDEDESEAGDVVLPLGFGACGLRQDAARGWLLVLELSAPDLPGSWSVTTPAGVMVCKRALWTQLGCPSVVEVRVDVAKLPLFLKVRWDVEGGSQDAVWTVIPEDRHQLPPGLGLVDLRSEHLLRALASGKSVAEVWREELERRQADGSGPLSVVELNPLKRLDDRASLFRRGRALATSLAALERRLARPVLTLDGLAARLRGPLGPGFVARKVCEECVLEDPQDKRAEALFTLAEIALVLARVPWRETLRRVDASGGLNLVRDALAGIDELCRELGDDPADVAAYARRAIQEAIQCTS